MNTCQTCRHSAMTDAKPKWEGGQVIYVSTLYCQISGYKCKDACDEYEPGSYECDTRGRGDGAN